MQDAYAYCEALVRELDRDRYLASLFLPQNARHHAFAIYAFNVEVSSARERAGQAMAGEVRFQWWRDVLAGSGRGDVRANPVAAALLDTVERADVSRPTLDRLIDARSFDLYDDAMPTTEALEGYLNATSSSLFDLVVRLSGEPLNDASDATRHAGLAYGITGLLRAFPLHASRGQVYVPADLLTRHGASDRDVLSGQATPALRSALSELRDLARNHLQHAQALPGAPFLSLALVEPYLRIMDRADYEPFRTPVEIPQWRRQWILWRAAGKSA